MKRLIVLSIVCCCLSCGDHGTTTVFYVKNASSHHVKLTVFNAEFQSIGGYKDSTFIIPSNSEVNISFLARGNNDYTLLPFGIKADSAYIIFDDSLRITYNRNDLIPRNILHFDSYSGGKKDDALYEYNYTISEADYNNAIHIK